MGPVPVSSSFFPSKSPDLVVVSSGSTFISSGARHRPKGDKRREGKHSRAGGGGRKANTAVEWGQSKVKQRSLFDGIPRGRALALPLAVAPSCSPGTGGHTAAIESFSALKWLLRQRSTVYCTRFSFGLLVQYYCCTSRDQDFSNTPIEYQGATRPKCNYMLKRVKHVVAWVRKRMAVLRIHPAGAFRTYVWCFQANSHNSYDKRYSRRENGEKTTRYSCS